MTKTTDFHNQAIIFFRYSRVRPDSVHLLQPNAAQDGLATPLTPSLSFLIVAPLALPPLSFPATLSFFFSLSPSFGPPLRFIARGRPTAEKPPCMERSVISTLSSKHTAFHIVLQGLGQIAIFMGHDKGNAALCSHFLRPGVGAGHAVIHPIGNRCSLSGVCCYVAERGETTSANIAVKSSNV